MHTLILVIGLGFAVAVMLYSLHYGAAHPSTAATSSPSPRFVSRLALPPDGRLTVP